MLINWNKIKNLQCKTCFSFHHNTFFIFLCNRKKLELYIEEIQRKLANKTKPQLAYEIVPTDTPHSSPFTTSDR